MKEYRMSLGWKIFLFIVAAGFAIGGTWLLFNAYQATTQRTRVTDGVFGVLLIPLGIYACYGARRYRLMIDQYSITLELGRTFRSLLLEEIKGYRHGEKGAFLLEPLDGGKSMQIPSYLESRTELISWLEQKYSDLDTREYGEEMELLLEDQRFGLSKEEREASLAKARNISKVASVVSFGLLFWAMLYPRPYEILTLLLIIVPWIALAITWYFKGLMKLDTKKSSPYPSVVLLFFFPTLGLLMNVLRAFDLYPFESRAWAILVVGAFLLTVVCGIVLKQAINAAKQKALTFGIIFILSGIYMFGALIFFNCYYDRSAPQTWEVQVASKHINKGKSTTYYLDLSPWGRFEKGKSVSVSRSFYEQVDEKDSVNVYLRKGALNIPWYWVSKR